MRVVALVSGGKDSCFNMMHCIANGHDIVALANLKPECQNDEIDSFMYQTVGHHVIDLYAEAMGLPLFRRTITGSTKCDLSTYQQESGDEVEDLYELLKHMKEKISFDGVSSGAILSNYQRVRVENVCSRLNLKSLAYLWRRDQTELLSEMIQGEVNAIIIKVAALGLSEKHLGKSLAEIEPHMLKQSKQFGLNPCGEGGEYETLTLDCPIFLKKIVVDESKVILHSDDAFAPVAYLSFSKMHLEDKGMAHDASLSDRLKNTKIKKLLPKWFDVDEFEETLSSNMADEVPTKDNSSQLNTVINPVVKTTEKKIWISELYCVKEENMEFESCVIKSMCMLKDMVETNKFSLKELSLVHLYVNNMQQFPRINKIYGQYFKVNPPSRVCVELELPANVIFKMEAIGHKLSSCEKETLHVQSISYWAPANIGPYSQANKICR